MRTTRPPEEFPGTINRMLPVYGLFIGSIFKDATLKMNPPVGRPALYAAQEVLGYRRESSWFSRRYPGTPGGRLEFLDVTSGGRALRTFL